MGQVVKRRSKTGEVTYSARIRKQGVASLYATFSRKTDADAWIQEQERKIRLGIHLESTQAEKHTFAEAVERYLRENPITSRQKYLVKVWKDAFAPMYLSTIDEIKINDVCGKWRHEGRSGKNLGASAINRYLSAISVVFKASKNGAGSERTQCETPSATRSRAVESVSSPKTKEPTCLKLARLTPTSRFI